MTIQPQYKIFNYVAAAFIVFLLILWYWQNRQPGPKLFPGEHIEKDYEVPVIASVHDKECTDAAASSDRGGATSKAFKVLKDTAYYLTVRYLGGDSTRKGCQAVGALYKGDSVLMSRSTACPPGSPPVDYIHLKPGGYVLSVSLQTCEGESCQCGKHARADAAISIHQIN